MENDRRDDPQPEAVSPQPEAPAYREAEERREDYAGEEQPREQYRDDAPESATFDSEGRQTSDSEQGAPPPDQQSAGAPGGQGHPDRDRGGRGRGGRRGGRRMSQRERRQDRGRRRDHRPGFSGAHHGGGGYQQHGGGQPASHPRDQGAEAMREAQPRPEGSGSILNDIRAEVERLREVLEGVLRDLEDVAEQLIKAEHEKDLAEAEIEQLREQLRRLHR